ncbi:MAG: hypothetical protein J1F07_00515 [Muribaculaceae bacterium]|nr:hypothetical protein [Muribaculaceae bacterium]
MTTEGSDKMATRNIFRNRRILMFRPAVWKVKKRVITGFNIKRVTT